jgi:hypothetical protein
MLYRLKNKKGDALEVFVLGMIALCILLLIVNAGYGIAYLTHQENYEFTVTEKSVKYEDKSSKYLIYGTVDGETLVIENTDEFWYGKFNSSDIYAEIIPGRTYRIKVVGFRIPFFSQYQNLIEYQLIDN